MPTGAKGFTVVLGAKKNDVLGFVDFIKNMTVLTVENTAMVKIVLSKIYF